jgi:hypothetical protein
MCSYAWATLSAAQQVGSEQLFLLACAFADHQGGLPKDFVPWRQQLTKMRTQRRGQLPASMLRVSERKGFALE